jgi:lysocardiolipin and lysophospholipid acyltransferase
MDTQGLRKRPATTTSTKPVNDATTTTPTTTPSKTAVHGTWDQTARLVGLIAFFFTSAFTLHLQQWLGAPLYFYAQGHYYSWQALCKQHFALVLVSLTGWWTPTTAYVTWDPSVAGEVQQTASGDIKLSFPERLVLISNHQLYSDWIFLWWAAYSAGRHGHLFIVLKESIKYIPLLGPGMMYFSFIFLSRKWESDKPRLQHRLKKLQLTTQSFLSGPSGMDPMWLLIFPEGTTLCENGRIASKKWAEKSGVEDLRNTLIPRSRGLQFCLEELKSNVEFVYDCTLSYEGIP